MLSRLIGLARRFGPTMLTTVVSQGISALALLSIVLLGTELSDVYALGIQIGTSALSGVILQVVYFLAVGRPWMRSWRLWSALSAVFSLAFAAAVVAVTSLTTGMAPRTAIIVLIFGVGGAFLALAGVIAVRAACAGRPVFMVGLTIAPNAGLALAAVIVRAAGLTGDVAAYLPAAVWTTTSVVVWFYCLGIHGPRPTTAPENESARAQTFHALTLVLGLVGGTIYPALFVGALAQLPAGTTTVLFLISRIGTSLVGLLVSSVLSVRFNWNSEVLSTARLATVITTAAVLIGGAGVALDVAGQQLPAQIVIGVSWLAAITAAPLVVREMHARRMVLATAIRTFVDLGVVLVVGTWFLMTPSVTGFFGIYVLLQSTSLVGAGIAFRRPGLTVAASALALLGLAEVFLPLA